MARIPLASLIALASGFGAAIGPGPLCAQEGAPAIGIVDDVSGRWRVRQGNRLLAKGDLLYARETIAAGSATTGFIRVYLFAGGAVWEQECSEDARCAGSYRPSRSEAGDRDFWAFLSSFWQSGRQLPPQLARARSVTAGPAHAYVRVTGDGVDLRPALERLPAARYTIRLVPAPGGSLDGMPVTHDFPVSVVGEAPVRVAGLRQGLYVLTVMDEAGQTVGASTLLLAGAGADSSTKAFWNAALEASARSLRDPVARSSLLAQTLYALDAQRPR